MKAQILKIAGVKSEKEFYKKFPTEEAFMKKHGKEFKKAQVGTNVATSAAGSFNIYNPYGDAMQSADMSGMQSSFSKPTIDYSDIEMPEHIQNPNFGSKQQLASDLYAHKSQFDVTGDPLSNSELRASKRDILGKSPSSDVSAQQIVGAATGIMDAASAFKGQKKKLQQLRQQKGVADVSLKAAESVDVDARRQQSENIAKQRQAQMPVNTGEEFFPIYGVGTNPLARNGARLKDGGPVRGNSGEIQNTFAPNDIYMDSGYEPLNDSNIKQYYHGGNIYQAQNGFSSFMGAGGTDFANKAVGKAFNNNAGYQMGSAVGGALAMIPGVGPVASAIAKPLLGAAGGLADNLFGSAGKIKTEQRGLDRTMMGIQNAGSAKQTTGFLQNIGVGKDGINVPSYEDGGWVSHDWQPQVIASFGGLNEQEVYDYAHEGMDTLRAGGHLRSYTPPSERALQTYEDGGEIKSYGLGGELQTYWGGGAETLSHNPYLPGTGETVMFRGKSHEEKSPNGETGIGVTYGGNPVEVERGEPMVELEEGGTVDPETGEVQKSGVVFGNLQIPNQYIDLLGDKNAKGKKFKNYVADLSKIEEKQNKIIDKSSKELNALDPLNSFDKLKLTALQANIQGANMKLKDIADKKINAASLQNAINDTAEEHGLVADDLARGKVKIDKEAQEQYAKFGGKFTQAKDGDLISKFNNTKKETEIALKKLYPGKKVELKIASEDRDIKTQRGLKGSGASKTDVSLHNIGGAKDFVIYVDGKRVDDADVYKKTLHPAAQKYGLHTLQDWDPYHVSAVQEGKGHPYAQAVKDYPELLKGKTTANTIAYLTEKVNSKQASPSELRAYSQLTGKSTKNIPPYNVDYSAEAKQANSPKIEWEDAVVPIDNTTPAATSADSTKQTTPAATTPDATKEEAVVEETPKKTNWWDTASTVFNAILPSIRPSDAEELDAAQLYPEMFAMATNQVAPVQAQTYQPDLGVPYDISFQDQLNANQADYRAAQRMMGYNPAAQANLNAQKYQANQSVLADQFRANQAMKDKVYGENRNMLNQAKLTNLGIFDKQYERQTEALANTKATTQAALNSIADKYAKNKLENRTLQTYENMYNYRFGPNFRAQNMNPLAQFDTDYKGMSSEELDAMSVLKKAQEKREAAAAKKDTKTATARNGSIVKHYKNI